MTWQHDENGKKKKKKMGILLGRSGDPDEHLFLPLLSGFGPCLGCGVDRTPSWSFSVFLGICSDSPRLEPVPASFFCRQPGLARGAGPFLCMSVCVVCVCVWGGCSHLGFV